MLSDTTEMEVFMTKKSWIIIAFIILIVLIGIVFFFWNRNSNNESPNYNSSRTASNTSLNTSNTNTQNTNNSKNSTNNSSKEETNQNTSITNTNQNNASNSINNNSNIVETEISNFSTKIYTKDSSRQKNIEITCSTLNNTIVKKGETFSFCSTIGPSTTSKGYEKADIFDRNGQKKKGLGGGNCQVSTTLYNAVLAVPSLKVTERHEHSNKVPYIATGKDAAVAYGSYDLKFRNDSEYDVKIKAEANNSNVTIKLLSLKS